MRRLLVFCAVAVMIFAALAALRLNHVATVSAAGGQGSLALFSADPDEEGCPLGPTFTFCDQILGGLPGPQAGFHITATSAVSSLSVSFAAISGMASNFAVGDFTVAGNTCTGGLAAGQQCVVDVAFSPTAAGLRAAALTVTDAAGDTLAINIEGTGRNLAMSPPPAPACIQGNAYTYCNEAVGGASSAETFTLNARSAVTGMTVSLVPISGLSSEFAAGDFTIAGTTCTGALAALASCTVSVEFTPKEAGLRAAALTATDSNGDTTAIYLAGQTTTGLAFPLPLPSTNAFACARVNLRGFCSEPQGGTTATNTFTVTNISGAQITGLTITPPVTPPTPPPPPAEFTVTGTSCVSTLAAGASCTINVAFTPQGTGLRQGTIAVTDTQGDVAGFNLAGVGDDYNLQLAASQQQEVTIVQGGTATFNGVVNPDGVFGQNGEQVTFACPTTLPVNTSCVITPCPAKITPGTPATFQMVLVTSTQKVVAPIPPQGTGCASYGPPGTTEMLPAPDSSPRAPHFPTLLPALPEWAVLCAIALLIACLTVLAGGGRSRKRVPLVFAVAGIAAAALTGCHHSSMVGSPATPVGTTTMTFQAPALDANGNPLNASRPGPQIMLDIVQATQGPFP
ncbi:MAG: choice-of-anchor D domain-containing protein [Candidatus Acidiferrales bacterium]